MANNILGILFPQLAKSSLVRTGPASFSDQLQMFIAKKLFPDQLAVRGNLVAIDYITEALLRHGTMSRYELFVEPSFREAAQAFLDLRKNNGQHDHPIHISSTLDLLDGVDKYSFTAFFNPAGNFSQPLIMRNQFGSRLYPVTILTHGFSLHSMLYDGFLRLLLEGTYPCDSLICTSRASKAAMANILDHVAEQFNRKFRTNIKYSGRLDQIPLCVDTEKFHPLDKAALRKQLKLPKEAIILLYMGYVSALKADLLPLLHVFRRLIKQNPKRQLLLMIAGTRDALYAKTLEDYIRQFSLSKHVRLMDSPSDKTKYALTAAADVFVSPGDSVQESFGITPIEAMACGIPQVVADWDGYRDTVSHGETGFLVPTYWTKCDSDLANTGNLLGWEFDHLALGQSVAIDVEALQSYLQILIENEQLRQSMAERSRKRAEALFSFPAVARRYEELWSELAPLARGLGLAKTAISFDSTSYFQCFKSHASSALTDDSCLNLTPLGHDVSEADLRSLVHPRVSSVKTIDFELVRCALDGLRAHSSSNGNGANGNGKMAAGVRFADFTESLSKNHAFHPDYVRRNLMWLMKHGLVKPVTQPSEPGSSRRTNSLVSELYFAGAETVEK
ncbi:MAG TPA: glycosyltransferase family 4 protein [Candidatus Angelobacter sp.]|jgi:glycosyltransferase involved in cell wall biosynthesis|nr:glycosyltransferase family 4 protein [Candidatus Angelobacter sp.]